MLTDSTMNDLPWLVQCYGHCIPRNGIVSGRDFAELIRSVYDCRLFGRNEYAARVAESLPGEFYNIHCAQGYRKPAASRPTALSPAF